MEQDYFDKMTKLAIPDELNLDDVRDDLERSIKIVLKEVERDFRHKAVSHIHDLANRVHNMKPD